MRSQQVRDKVVASNMAHHGVPCSWSSTQVKEKIRQHNLATYGVEWHTQSDNFKRKAADTWREKYGVDHPMRASEVKAKYDFRALWAKAHATKKVNGTYACSAIEQKFYESLCDRYGAEDVERQCSVEADDKRWLIDFYVRSIDAYIQFDGAYWHGTDRSLSEIKENGSARDVAILAAYERDRQQDAWFAERGLTLLRITDADFIASMDSA